MIKTEFKTFDQMCLDKLKELDMPTRTQWAKAMGYFQTNGLHKNIVNLVKKGLVLQIGINPYRYKLPEATT